MEENSPPTPPLIAQVVESFITSVDGLADTFPLAMKALADAQWKNIEKTMSSFISLMHEYIEFHYLKIKDKDEITHMLESLYEKKKEYVTHASDELSKEELEKFKEKSQEIFEMFLETINQILKDVSWMRSSSQRLPSMTIYLQTLMEHGQKMLVADKLMRQSFITSLISQYDAFLGKLIRALFLMKPETLNISERNISFSQLRDFNTIDDAREYIMRKEIENVLRDSHMEQFKWLKNKFGLELREGLTVWTTFVEVTERRNLFTHNNGVVSDQYINVCQEHEVKLSQEVKIGTELDVTSEYFELAYECIFEIGVKLAHVLWRKVAPQSLDEADDNLNAICYNLLAKGHYKLACVLLDFATQTLKKHSDDNMRRIFIINRAQAYKWAGDDEISRKIVNGADWSASSDKFKLGVAVLLDDFDQADYLVKKIGSQGDVRIVDYREWPLFREYRKTEGFLKAFEEVFNEPFYSEKDLFVAVDRLKDVISSENSTVLHDDWDLHHLPC